MPPFSPDSPARRRDYRHFPSHYADLLHTFADRGQAEVGPMSRKDAQAAIRDLYRFKTFLSHACDADPTDEYARELHTIFCRVMLRLEPRVEVTPTGSHVIVIQTNPIVAAVERQNREEAP